MRKVGALYLILLAFEFVLIAVIFTQRGLILSDASEYRVAWTDTWGGPLRDYSYDAVFSGDALFVTGASFSYGPGPLNLLLLKYSGDGELIWNQTYWEGRYTMGRGLATDGASVYVSGIHIAEDAAYSLLLKYDQDGGLIWSREWRPGPDAKASGVALDPAGNIYVTGYVIESDTENRGFLLKYTENGDLLFSKVFESNGTETDWGLAVGDAVYVCGEVTMNTTILEKTGVYTAKMLLRKVSLDGETIWSREASIGLDNVANSVDSAGDVVVAGYVSFNNGTSRGVLLRYSRDGELRSTQMLGTSTLGDMAWGVTQAGSYTYVVGHARPDFTDLSDLSIYKLGPDGEVLWENYYSDYSIDGARAVTVHGDDVYVVGETYWRALDIQVLVRKYVSPNVALPPEVSQALILSPIAVGALLLVVALYMVARFRGRGVETVTQTS
jgi:hypothetical protein